MPSPKLLIVSDDRDVRLRIWLAARKAGLSDTEVVQVDRAALRSGQGQAAVEVAVVQIEPADQDGHEGGMVSLRLLRHAQPRARVIAVAEVYKEQMYSLLKRARFNAADELISMCWKGVNWGRYLEERLRQLFGTD